MSIVHHLDDDVLLEYATGTLAEGWSIAVATHLALCPHCRERYQLMELTGGALLDTLEPVAASPDSWTALKARLQDETGAQPAAATPAVTRSGGQPVLPEPLRSYVGSDVDGIAWKSLPGAAQFLIPTSDGETMVRLLRIPAGKPVPEHTHRGREFTLVLSGAFSDGEDVFRRGDIEVADASLMHTPVATPDADCICLAVTDAPLKFKSWMVRMVQPMLGI